LEPNLDNFYSVGTLGKISLDLTHEANVDSVINSLQEIYLEGLERVQIVNPIKVSGSWKSEYQVILEPEQNRGASSALIEKFVKHLPNILKKTNLALAEKLPYLAMGDLGNFIDFLTQVNPEIPRWTKQAILSNVDLSQRLDYLLGLSAEKNEQKSVDKDISNRVNAETKKEERIYYLRKIVSKAQEELQKLEGSEGGS
jgi:ATP-dependent Lon protease